MSNLQRTQIIDANGHVTHRNKRVEQNDIPSRYTQILPPTDPRSTVARTGLPLSSDDVADAMDEMSDLVANGKTYHEALGLTAITNGERGIIALLTRDESTLRGDALAKALAARSENLDELPVELEAKFGSQWKPVLDAVMRFGSMDSKGSSDMFKGHKVPHSMIEVRDMWTAIRANTDLGEKADNAALAMRVAHPENGDEYSDKTATRLADSAVRAMVLKDSIGTHGVTQEYYDRETSHLIRGIGQLI